MQGRYRRAIDTIKPKKMQIIAIKRATLIFNQCFPKRYDSIQTWFFRANIKDLLQYFVCDESIVAMKNSCIEYVWMDSYRKNSVKIRVNNFKIYPDAEGINSSGNLYTSPKIKLFIKNVMLKLGWYTVK